MSSEADRRSSAFAAASVPENYERRLAPVIFEPWAEILVDSITVRCGANVLDVASGTGVVARLAARLAGAEGRVVASDASAAMLAQAATLASASDAARIEYLEGSAADLPVADGTFDVVLCQQGLPFFSDRPAAAAEMRRVLRPGGVVGLSVWAAGHRLEPFDDYAEALAAAGVPPPYPRAFENASFVMGSDELEALFKAAGFAEVEVSLVSHVVVWPDVESAVTGILGTPFGPLVSGLPPDHRAALDADLRHRFATSSPGEPVRRTTSAVIARATAPWDPPNLALARPVPATSFDAVSAELATLVFLAAELVLLRRGQRRLFWRLGGGSALRPFTYLAVMPGTVLHEGSHLLACRVLGVPIVRAQLFRPRRRPDGSLLLGSVSHARTGPLRGALISVAPVVLVPAALAGASAVLLGPQVLGHLPHGLSAVPPWRLALCGWCALSCAQAAFPSPGDHVGVLGAAVLGMALAILLLALGAVGGPTALRGALRFAAALLALPAGVAAAALALLRAR